MRTPTIQQANKILLFEIFDAIAMCIKAANIAAMAAQQKPPIAKEGGIVKGYNRQGVNLPDGSQIIPNDIAEQIAKENDKINIIVVYDGKKLK